MITIVSIFEGGCREALQAPRQELLFKDGRGIIALEMFSTGSFLGLSVSSWLHTFHVRYDRESG